MLRRHMDLVVRLGRGMVDRDRLGCRLERGLACLRLDTERVLESGCLHLLDLRRCKLQLLLLLHLLRGKLEALLKDLHHLVTLLLFVDELLVEDFVDVRDWLLNLREHELELTLQLWHDLPTHSLLKLILDDFANLSVCQL